MRALLQRVHSASVMVGTEVVSQIASGWLILLGIATNDTELQARLLSNKIKELRAFSDQQGKMNLSLVETGGEVLLVSQFTLYADCRKGRRPSFNKAAPPDLALRLYEHLGSNLRQAGITTKLGSFGEEMQVKMLGHGPVTIMLDTDEM